MVHADASNFEVGITKEEAYQQVLSEIQALVDGQRNWVCNLANAASLLWHAYKSLPAPSSAVNWAGFYVVDKHAPNSLILGPFQGKVACQTIAFGRGVCGAAAEGAGQTVLVHDVLAWPGHIACDAQSRSEVVVPVRDGQGRVRGVIDVDCALVGGFDAVDVLWLERVAGVLGEASDWE